MENSPKESTKSVKYFDLPKQYKIISTILASALGIISIYIYLIFVDPKYLEPEKFGLSNLLIFFLTFLLFINVPWAKLGLRIKKIGIIELEEKIEGQAKDVSQDIAELQLKIDKIEKSIGITSIQNDNKLEGILSKFLKQYSRWAFSPSRIKVWGPLQPGHEALKDYSLDEIKSELRRMLAKNHVVTTVSKKGYTLYRYVLNNQKSDI